MIKKFAEFINEDVTDIYSRLIRGIKREESTSSFMNEVNVFISKHKNLSKNDYTINSNNTVDFNVSLKISTSDLNNGELPFKFGRINGDFDCSSNGIKTLKNCPDYVDGSFIIGDTYIKSLEGCPKEVGTFGCTGCDELESLEYLSPVIKHTLNTKGTDFTVNDIPEECEIGEKIIMDGFKWRRDKDNCDWKEKRD